VNKYYAPFAAEFWLRISSIAITLVFLVIFEIINRFIFPIPAQPAMMLMLVAYATFVGGMTIGFINVGLVLAYSIYYLSDNLWPLSYSPVNLFRLLVLIVLSPLLVIMIGWLRRRLARQTEALYESEMNYRLLFENSLDGILLTIPDGRILKANPAICRILGYDEPEIVALGRDGILDTADPRIAAFIKERERTGAAKGELTLIHKDGTKIPCEVTSQVFKDRNNNLRTSMVVHDLHLRKQLEQALQESEARYRSIVTTLHEGIVIQNADGQIITCNPSAERILGLSAEQMMGRSSLDPQWRAVHEDGSPFPGEEHPIMVSLRTGQPCYNVVMGVPKPNGELVWTLVNSQVMHLPGELEYSAVVASFVDITPLKRAESLLITEKERLAVTLRSIGDAVITTDNQGQTLFLNRAAETLTGWTQAEALGRPLETIFRIVDEYSRQLSIDPVKKVLATGQVVTLANHTLLISRNSTEYSIADSGAPIRDKDGNIQGVVLVFRDVTKEKKLAEELSKASRLESVGLLAGGIAHDFNNLLTAIVGSISLMRLNPDRQEIEAALTVAEHASLQAKELTNQLLTFAKGGAPVKKVTRLEEIIKESTTFALHGSRVRADYELSPELWPVEVDTGQFGQVVQNLVINAVQAMPQGGTICIKGVNLTLSANETLPLSPGPYVLLSLQDEGSGIPSANLANIFDPYFTTKTGGHGLGLATCYSIIKRHKGHIAVESQPGCGTTFYIYLPASAKKLEEIAPNTIALTMEGKGRILVMDDESLILKTLDRALTRVGYQVKTVSNGIEALTSYNEAQQAGQPFDVVIMDLTIPGGMGGKESITQLLKIDPHAKVIVSSGYSADSITSNYRQFGFSAAVTKPYKLEDLTRTINELVCNP
jgi:PAS domain S-box-containing protein